MGHIPDHDALITAQIGPRARAAEIIHDEKCVAAGIDGLLQGAVEPHGVKADPDPRLRKGLDHAVAAPGRHRDASAVPQLPDDRPERAAPREEPAGRSRKEASRFFLYRDVPEFAADLSFRHRSAAAAFRGVSSSVVIMLLSQYTQTTEPHVQWALLFGYSFISVPLRPSPRSPPPQAESRLLRSGSRPHAPHGGWWDAPRPVRSLL